MPGEVTVTVTIDRRVLMHRVADSMSNLDFSLRWQYAYSSQLDTIICQDMITGAWYRVPMNTSPASLQAGKPASSIKKG